MNCLRTVNELLNILRNTRINTEHTGYRKDSEDNKIEPPCKGGLLSFPFDMQDFPQQHNRSWHKIGYCVPGASCTRCRGDLDMPMEFDIQLCRCCRDVLQIMDRAIKVQISFITLPNPG